MKAIMILSAFFLMTPMILAQYNEAFQAGQLKRNANKFAEARQDFEQALKLASTPKEKADALFAIGFTYNGEQKYSSARTEFEKVLSIQNLTPAQKVQAQMNVGRSCEMEYTVKAIETSRAYSDALTALSKVSDIANATYREKFDAKTAAVNMYVNSKNFADASRELREILSLQELTPNDRVLTQLKLGEYLLDDRKYEAARNELAKVIALKESPDSCKAEAQLKIGLCYYAERDYEHAKTDIGKVLTMPNADKKQIHEAKLYLSMKNIAPANEKVLTVLFIGASQTQVFDVPQIVETLAASAPPGTARIMTDGFLRGGTGIQRFWEEGEGPKTAREKIMAAPWDFVVFETHPLLHGRDIFVRYGTRFSNVIRENHATPVFLKLRRS